MRDGDVTRLDTARPATQVCAVNKTRADAPHAPERRALLLVDHGSRRSQANALLDEVAALVKQRLGAETIVEPAHMELGTPSIAEGFARCVEQGATRIVVHPFMLAPGRHVSDDLPRLVTEAARAHQGVAFVLSDPLGTHPGVIDAVVDRCGAVRAEDEPNEP
jgi:sirohydrochlorin ferrochelatase